MPSTPVPYQAYRSKRHSHSASALLIPPNVPPPTDPQRPPAAECLASVPIATEPPPPPVLNGSHSQPSSAPKKASTFRRLHPPRPSLPSSTLRPPGPQSRAPSSSSSVTRQLDRSPPPPSSSLHSPVPSVNSIISDVQSSPNNHSPSHTPNTSLVPTAQPSPIPQPPPTSVSPSPPVASPRASTPRSSAPYRPGFQPRGVYRHRTDEFSQIRKAKHDATRVERTKLERRLEKLIHLHFPVQTNGSNDQKQPSVDRRKSAFFDLDLANLKNIDTSDIWKGVVQSQALQGPKATIRAAEQRIAPWQEDAAVSKCPLCGASFHPLTNRKHHCRLCGQIICSLPIKRPQRPEPCSILFIVDSKTRRIEEVGEGVDYGVKRKASGAGTGKGSGKEKQKEDPLPDDEKFLKGVRLCRSCKPILSREQFYQQVSRIPPLIQLYEAFISLEKEIEEALPRFQELVLTLNSDSPPNKEATAARKHILNNFASYDAISERIRKIPNTPGSSQDRVQLAIRTRADLFLQKNMFPLQSLPKAKKQVSSPDATTPLVDPDSGLAHALQPLLEQEALLESFVGEAMARRKFEDAKTLKANLKEIRVEINRILENQAGSGNDS